MWSLSPYGCIGKEAERTADWGPEKRVSIPLSVMLTPSSLPRDRRILPGVRCKLIGRAELSVKRGPPSYIYLLERGWGYYIARFLPSLSLPSAFPYSHFLSIFASSTWSLFVVFCALPIRLWSRYAIWIFKFWWLDQCFSSGFAQVLLWTLIGSLSQKESLKCINVDNTLPIVLFKSLRLVRFLRDSSSKNENSVINYLPSCVFQTRKTFVHLRNTN